MFKKLLRNIASVSKLLPPQLTAQWVDDINAPVVNVARSKVKRTYLTPVIDNKMQFKAIKPPDRVFPPRRAEFKHFMAVNTPVIAYFQGGRVDKADARRFPAPESLGIQEHGEQGVAHKFHKPVITDQIWKIILLMSADMPFIIPLETAVSGQMEQHYDGHHFA